jgi:hypothetical protein
MKPGGICLAGRVPYRERLEHVALSIISYVLCTAYAPGLARRCRPVLPRYRRAAERFECAARAAVPEGQTAWNQTWNQSRMPALIPVIVRSEVKSRMRCGVILQLLTLVLYLPSYSHAQRAWTGPVIIVV